jgi:FkbM family methyltransferase
MKPFTEEMRYEYPLKPDDLVIDVGGYEGKFSNEIRRRYGCRVWCFEPVFCESIKEHLDPAVRLFENGLGDGEYTTEMHIKGDSTGAWADGDPRLVRVLDAVKVISEPVALLKLNCEGGEFEILRALLDRGDVRLIENIQVQFHPIFPDAEERWQRIRECLLETHELTYDAPWCWENYKLK